MKSLYIHIPFCDQICYYCDFPKRIAKDELKTKYIDYLIKELSMHDLSDIITIYIGGGTPSSLDHSLITKLLNVLPKAVEFTFECNPNDINEEFLNVIKSKVTRISLGVQTFDDELLIAIGRKHTASESFDAINLINKYGYQLSIDLIFNLPNQTLEQIKYDLKNTDNIGHLSYYSLILEEKTVFDKLVREEKIDFNEENEFYEYILDYLTENEFEHYEISNFAKDHKSLHNQTYWHNLEYIACGLAASGYEGYRYKNYVMFKDYFEALDNGELPIMSKTTITKEDEMYEHLMLGFRLLEGISISGFKSRFNIDIFDHFNEINKLVSEDFLFIENDKIKLTRKGLLFNNDLLVRLL